MASDNVLEFWKEELESDQVSVRANAIHRTPIVAALIGEKAVEKEIIPYFESLIAKEDDEVIFGIAKQLGLF